jgi:hypothetical protein
VARDAHELAAGEKVTGRLARGRVAMVVEAGTAVEEATA